MSKCHYADPYTYVKGPSFQRIFGVLLGDGSACYWSCVPASSPPELTYSMFSQYIYQVFNSDGDHWKVQRKTASNIFNVKNFRDVYAEWVTLSVWCELDRFVPNERWAHHVPETSVFIEESHLLASHLRAAAKGNAVIDLQDLFLRSTLDSFGRIALSTSFGCMKMENARIEKGRYMLKDMPFMEAFDSMNNLITRRGPNPFWRITELLDGTTSRMKRYMEILEGTAHKVIKEKQDKVAQGKAPTGLKCDLLDLFMQTTNDDGSELTLKQLRDVLLNFMIAGRDTTAQTLSWVFWRLSQNPSVEKKTREEILRVVGKGEPSYDAMKSLVYTHAVFNETLRLHANVPSNRKEVTRDDILPGTKTPVRKGDIMTFHPFVMGYSTKIWGEDANEFKPERWINEDGSLRKENQFKWPVFNAGPRVCLGMNMATQEAVVFMVALLREFHLELVNEDDPKHWADYEQKQGRHGLALTLVMREGVEFRVHPPE
ncbi:hypothetical protein HDU93_000658 [Gonapodya sp. JEL0774]|nr:hypothetical protein HDU93_000658 [Gonapodya sp. JEL0774]